VHAGHGELSLGGSIAIDGLRQMIAGHSDVGGDAMVAAGAGLDETGGDLHLMASHQISIRGGSA
jgi:hypothetical protein